MNWISEARRLVELKAKYFLLAWLLGALFLFLPMDIKAKLGVSELPEIIKPWIGFGTLIAFGMWIAQMSSAIPQWVRRRAHKKEILAHLNTLSIGERDIFIQCLLSNQRTINRNLNDSAANSLVMKGLLQRGSGSVLALPFIIPTFAWTHIKKNEAKIFPEIFDQKEIEAFNIRKQNGWMRN